MGKIFVLALIIAVFLSCSAYARQGIGITPGCYGADSSGNCIPINIIPNQTLEYEFHIYNFQNMTSAFSVYLNGEISQNMTIAPTSFNLKTHSGPDCERSPGCKVVILKVNTSKIPPGNHTMEVIAQNSLTKEGTLQINQIVKSRVLLNMPSPPELKTSAKREILMASAAIIILLIVFYRFKHKNKSKKQNKEQSREEGIKKEQPRH